MLKDESNNMKSLSCEIVKSEGFSGTIQCFLKSNNNDLKTNTIGLLSEMLKNEDAKGTAEEISKGHIKSDNTRSMDNAIKLLTELLKDGNIQTNVVQIVKNCLDEKDLKLRSNAIKLLTNALKSKNADIKNFVEEFFSEEKFDLDNKNEVFTGKIGECLGSRDSQLIADAIKLLTKMLKNKDIQTYDETIINDYSGKIKGYLLSENDQLKANTIALLTEMLKSENTDLANTAKEIIADGNVVEGQEFANIMKGCLGSGNDGLKAKVVELLNNMLVCSDDELKNKSREILKSDVLNTKGMLNIFLKNEGGVNKEAISLLSPMCKDEKIKDILSGLIGKDLVEKLEGQENDIKSDDVVNMLYENVVVKGIFSEGNKKYIIDILKDEDGLHNVDINFDKNGQIKEVKSEKQKSFFKGEELNLKALKEQSIKDFSRDLKSIKTANGSIINAEGNRTKNEEFLEKIFEDAEISKDAKDLIYKFPGQSAFFTRSVLVTGGAQHLDGVLTFNDTMCSKLNSCGITVNTDGSVEVQMRRIGIINTGPLNLPMAIEEVHTFKINKGEDTYKTTDAKITVYKLEKTSIQLTEENLKKQKVLSQVSYNRDKDNNEKNKKV